VFDSRDQSLPVGARWGGSLASSALDERMAKLKAAINQCRMATYKRCYLGFKARGFHPTPKLFGAKSFGALNWKTSRHLKRPRGPPGAISGPLHFWFSASGWSR